MEAEKIGTTVAKSFDDLFLRLTDHLVGDLTPFDSMAQRLGRVNRFGDGDARVDVVYTEPAEDPKPFDQARERTLSAYCGGYRSAEINATMPAPPH